MEIIYIWVMELVGLIWMMLCNCGELVGFFKVMVLMMKLVMRRVNCKDLVKLKALLES